MVTMPLWSAARRRWLAPDRAVRDELRIVRKMTKDRRSLFGVWPKPADAELKVWTEFVIMTPMPDISLDAEYCAKHLADVNVAISLRVLLVTVEVITQWTSCSEVEECEDSCCILV